MLRSMNDAHDFLVQEVEKITWEKPDATEQAILEDLLEESLFEKIGNIISEQELEKASIKNDKDLETYLSNSVPNYLALLEEATTEVLADYLSE